MHTTGRKLGEDTGTILSHPTFSGLVLPSLPLWMPCSESVNLMYLLTYVRHISKWSESWKVKSRTCDMCFTHGHCGLLIVCEWFHVAVCEVDVKHVFRVTLKHATLYTTITSSLYRSCMTSWRTHILQLPVVKLWRNAGERRSSSVLAEERRSTSLYDRCGWTSNRKNVR